MSDRFPGRRDPARLPTGGVPAYPATSSGRALRRVATIRNQLGHDVPVPEGPEPARRHDIIPEQTATGYRCAVCLVAIAPADYATGPAWRHAVPGER